MENIRSKIGRDTVIKIIQAVLCTAYVIFMTVQVIGIYISGAAAKAADPRAQIYTPEAAYDAIIKGLPLLILAVIVTVAAAVLGVKNKEKKFIDPSFARDIAVHTVGEPTAEMKAERAKQKKLGIGGWAAFTIAMLPIALYMTNSAHFERSDMDGLETVIASMVLFILPWVIIGTGLLSISFILIDRSIRKETGLAKDCKKTVTEHQVRNDHSRSVVIIRCAALITAAVFIILGISNDGARAVLSKAITICTECIGLG